MQPRLGQPRRGQDRDVERVGHAGRARADRSGHNRGVKTRLGDFNPRPGEREPRRAQEVGPVEAPFHGRRRIRTDHRQSDILAFMHIGRCYSGKEAGVLRAAIPAHGKHGGRGGEIGDQHITVHELQGVRS